MNEQSSLENVQASVEKKESNETHMQLHQEFIEMSSSQSDAMLERLDMGEVDGAKFIKALEEGEVDTDE